MAQPKDAGMNFGKVGSLESVHGHQSDLDGRGAASIGHG